MAENMFERDAEVTAFWLAEAADWRGFPDKAVIRGHVGALPYSKLFRRLVRRRPLQLRCQ